MGRQMMCMLQLVEFLCLFLCSAEADRNIRFIAGESRFNREYFDNFSFSIRNDQIFLEMNLRRPLPKGWRARLDFQLRVGNSKSFQSLFSTSVDVCHIVNAAKVNLFKKWYKNMLKYGNFLRQCPLKTGHYYLRGWQFGEGLVPPFITSGSYRLQTYNFYGKYKGKDEDFIMSCTADAIIHQPSSDLASNG
ncbi:GL18090 [Drosophila persimilis]|uniref:GL18090 n=1 Tax=Drosophila persimilis TaxID=7234 RepID=B4HC37_DROPE|nr:GL18090 [Drosophila persimilis]